jgi:hypothetical protein
MKVFVDAGLVVVGRGRIRYHQPPDSDRIGQRRWPPGRAKAGREHGHGIGPGRDLWIRPG